MSTDLKTLIQSYNTLQTSFRELKNEIETLNNNKISYENRLRDLLQMGANAKTLGIEIPYIMTEIRDIENNINLNLDTVAKLSIEISDISYKCVHLEAILNSYRVSDDDLYNKINSHICGYRYHWENTVDTKFRVHMCDECGEIIAIT